MSIMRQPLPTSSSPGTSSGEPRPLQQPPHPALRDVVTGEIRRSILSGALAPGTRLVEERLAEELGVSRNPVREALRSLETEGLVAVLPRRGAFVASLSEEEFRELSELRAELEGLSARFAARRVTPEIRARIEALLERGDAAAGADDREGLNTINDEFHGFLADAGCNRFLADFMRSLRDRTHWMYLSSVSWRQIDAWREHAAILRAIADGDEELAAILANRHVGRAVKAFAETVRHRIDGAEPA